MAHDGYATSLDGVFAAGDVRSGATKQVGSAAGEGIAALLSVRRALEQRHLKARSVAGRERAGRHRLTAGTVTWSAGRPRQPPQVASSALRSRVR